MVVSEFTVGKVCKNNKAMKVKGVRYGDGEMGGFMLWKKRPDLWCLELVVSGCKSNADGGQKTTGDEGFHRWKWKVFSDK